MRSHAVVIVRIVFQNPTQMFLVQDNDVVQTLAPDRSDQPFGKAVLPRRGRCNWLVSDAHGTQSARDDSAVDSISISDHIARSAIPRKSLGDLTDNPLRRRVGCDADPDEISAIKPDDDEAIQQLKANGRHYEQIHGGDVRRVVSQKGPPFLTWCACRKSKPDILVVQPAENWAAKNLPGPFDVTRERRILLQGEMRAGAI